MALFLSMRPVQWAKNLVVFLPFLFTIEDWWTPPDLAHAGWLLFTVTGAFLLLCLLSGSVYILNDVADRERDRLHPRKRNRPIASGRFGVPAALGAVGVMASVGLVASVLINQSFGFAAAVYLLLNLGYSTALKHVVLLDLMAVAAGYVLRLYVGTVVAEAVTSPWIYSTVGLGALLLVSGKRYSEIVNAEGKASSQRAVLGQYSTALMGQFMVVSAAASLIAYSLYTFTATNLPENQTMMLTIPFVVFGIFRYLYLVNTKNEGESPERLILKDAVLLLDIGLWTLSVAAVLLLNR